MARSLQMWLAFSTFISHFLQTFDYTFGEYLVNLIMVRHTRSSTVNRLSANFATCSNQLPWSLSLLIYKLFVSFKSWPFSDFNITYPFRECMPHIFHSDFILYLILLSCPLWHTQIFLLYNQQYYTEERFGYVRDWDYTREVN